MKPRNLWRNCVTPVTDFFFPPLCFSCSTRLTEAESRLCSACWGAIKCVGPDDYTVRILSDRFAIEGSVDEFHSAFYFEEKGVFQRVVHSLKYDAITVFGVELGKRIGEVLKQRTDIRAIDAIIPIPLHRIKLRERGHNQSESLCRGISSVIRSPVSMTLVKRSKNTVSQTHLTAEQRKNNVGDAFEIVEGASALLRGSTILVVDDVITTGSTIQAVGRVLKESGAAKVIAASAALAFLSSDGSSA